ncbi:MAG: hypothetical protein UX53_C0013G0009 [Candidatus Azambacteria bacterium GW2011_GWB2_46_37]|uniref:Uncharacterized protein n=2 Tax=Candidatus Azamiibacteriota TaxID=1752741 RepID=A0A0G1QCN9_9BACT|nr:MAG: hypothetical protein UX53_C0013G0009 [Candidatus Azambacteria bacterium GW2011_GWB2_46_37]KKU42791.1 MAG: hypothetical protein UX56_C0006G0010 [Candidatus Azambacteria bacterium GW2011_GWD2_46_48]
MKSATLTALSKPPELAARVCRQREFTCLWKCAIIKTALPHKKVKHDFRSIVLDRELYIISACGPKLRAPTWIFSKIT